MIRFPLSWIDQGEGCVTYETRCGEGAIYIEEGDDVRAARIGGVHFGEAGTN